MTTSEHPDNAGRLHGFFLEAQDRIVAGLQSLEPQARFREDSWQRDGGGGGRTRVIEGGQLFEKGGVNVSFVHGELSDSFAGQLPGTGKTFSATGLSLVLHPLNPRVPTVHANFRYLEKGQEAWWFGGGADLTPWVLQADDAVHFHRTWKDVCDRNPAADYRRFKEQCDAYFHLPHRGEARGIGGIFFDYLGQAGELGTAAELEQGDALVRDGCGSFLDAYLPIIERRKDEPWTEAERNWQMVRRGRYVEFNLVYDRGTIFGLKTGGRIESILMSLPSQVRWVYDHQPQPGYQQELVEVLRRPRDWLGLGA